MAKNLKRDPNRCPTHPGELLREDIIPALGKTPAEIARLLGVSRQRVSLLLNEQRPVTPEMAALLGTLFCDGPEIWLRMQAAYDAWHARRDVDVSHIKPLSRAA